MRNINKENTKEVWGIGIEHEFRVVDHNDGEVSAINPREGRIPPNWGEFIEWDRDHNLEKAMFLKTGEYLTDPSDMTPKKEKQKTLSVHEDLSVQPGYEVVTLNWKNATVEQQIKDLLQFEEYLTENAEKKQGYTTEINPFSFIPSNSIKNRSIEPSEIGQPSKGLGSYHISLTLPQNPDKQSPNERYKDLRLFLQHIQWIEPLIVGVTGTPSTQCVGDGGRFTEGSGRVALLSFANPGGTDLSGMRDYASWYKTIHARREGINLPWRKHAKFQVQQEFNQPGNDLRIRTNVKNQTGDQAFGVEIRFTDSFDAQYLEPLLRFYILLASNAVDRIKHTIPCNPPNKLWNTAMLTAMGEGYNAYMPKEYVAYVRQILDLTPYTKLLQNKQSLRLVDVLANIEDEIYELNKNNKIPRLMTENPKKKTHIHNINRDAWDYFLRHRSPFDIKVAIMELARTLPKEGIPYVSFKKRVYSRLGGDWSKEDTIDIADYLEYYQVATLKRNNIGEPQWVKPHQTQNIDEALKNPAFYPPKKYQQNQGQGGWFKQPKKHTKAYYKGKQKKYKNKEK
jgi:hypothetical protein